MLTADESETTLRQVMETTEPDRKDAVELCTRGLLERVGPTRQTSIQSLKKITDRQIDLSDQVSAEKEKFAIRAQESQFAEMVEKTKNYQQKLLSLQKAGISRRIMISAAKFQRRRKFIQS